jgi:hypothetical protein
VYQELKGQSWDVRVAQLREEALTGQDLQRLFVHEFGRPKSLQIVYARMNQQIERQ